MVAREYDIHLMHVLTIFSKNVAKHLGDTRLKSMQVSGRMQEGLVTDSVVLDPKGVVGNSEDTVGTLPTTGIPYVVVSGTVVVERSKKRTDVFPGAAIRFSVQEAGRFVPLDDHAWARISICPRHLMR